MEETLYDAIRKRTGGIAGGNSVEAGGVPLPQLSDLKGFSQDDLARNESGTLSDGQRAQLEAGIREDWLGLLVAVAIITVWSVASGNYPVGVISAGVMLITALSRIWSTQGALFQGTVAAVEGDATKTRTGGGEDPDKYWLEVGGLRLEMTSEAYRGFPQGGPYRVFYLPEAKRLISAKPLPGWRYIPSSPANNRRSWWKSISLELG